MSKKKGTKSPNVYHRKDFAGVKNNERITCKLCGARHYAAKYHWCAFKPSLLDLFCCAGGAAAGYYAAGFNVTGIDKEPRPNYPFEFFQCDALEYLRDRGHEYDFIHTSPPCQLYSNSTASQRAAGKQYVDLVPATRDALIALGKPAVIENVMQAPLRRDLVLRGEMFDLKVIRKRAFEFVNCTFTEQPPAFVKKSIKEGTAVTVYGKAGSFKRTGHGFGKERLLVIPEWKLDTVRQTWAYAMGIQHYCRDTEIAESIPPAYTHFIGQHIRKLFP